MATDGAQVQKIDAHFMSEFVEMYERTLLTQIYNEFFDDRLSGEDAQNLARAFLDLLPFQSQEQLQATVETLGRKYPTARRANQLFTDWYELRKSPNNASTQFKQQGKGDGASDDKDAARRDRWGYSIDADRQRFLLSKLQTWDPDHDINDDDYPVGPFAAISEDAVGDTLTGSDVFFFGLSHIDHLLSCNGA